ncbi:hypothetical protein BH23ACT6_BH23ACT6_21440 [soil metagenome]
MRSLMRGSLMSLLLRRFHVGSARYEESSSHWCTRSPEVRMSDYEVQTTRVLIVLHTAYLASWIGRRWKLR